MTIVSSPKFLKINRTPVFYIHQYSSKMYCMKSELIGYGRAVLGRNEKGICSLLEKVNLIFSSFLKVS